MAKAILVMDMPETCEKCNQWEKLDEYGEFCFGAGHKEIPPSIPTDSKPDWCPLIPAIGYVQPVGHVVSWEDDSDVD